MEFKEAQMQITASAFFDRLAQHGVVPGNQKEAMDLLEMGDALVANNAIADPEDRPSRVGQAKQALLQVLGSEEEVSPSNLDEQCIKQAHQLLDNNDEISEAVLKGLASLNQ
jgi:hypothetical protein